MESVETVPEPNYPNPPRWWWTKRIIVIGIVLIPGLGITWKWWDRQAHRRIEAEVAAIRARGERIDIADFDVAPVSAERNATLSILAAISSIPTVETNFVANLSARMANSPFTPNDRQGMERVAKASTTMRSFARMARFQPEVLWSTNPIKRSSGWANQTQLSRFMLVNALHEHLAGHDAEAIEIARDMLFHVDSLEQPTPNLLMHLIALAIGAITFETVAQIAPDLQVMPTSGATTRPTGWASRQQVQELIRTLLNDENMRQGLARGFQMERAVYFSNLPSNSTVAGLTPSMMSSTLARPWVELGILRGMKELDDLIAAAQTTDLAASKAAISTSQAGAEKQTRLTIAVQSPNWIPKFDGRLEAHFETVALRRIAAIRLAIRLYQLDHGGEFPARLEELVPNYLPTMPLDPTVIGAKPFNYSKSPQPVISLARRRVPLMRTQPSGPATTRASSGS